MALNFTDKQIKELTGQILAGPDKIKAAEQTKQQAIQSKADFKILDDQNEIYTNHYQESVINKYHDELKYIVGETRTNYDLANIHPAGKLADGNVHFPLQNPQWAEFEPMIVDSNKGLPINTSGFANHEGKWIAEVLKYVDEFRNGWNDGGASTTTELPGLSNSELHVDNPTGFSVGDRVLVLKGSIGSYVKIDSISSTPADPGPPPVPASNIFQVTIIAGATSIGDNATVQNFFSGFTDNQRETGTGFTSYYQFLFDFFKGLIDDSVNNWKTQSLDFQKNALDGNDAKEDIENLDEAKENLNNILQIIQDWSDSPEFGINISRFGDDLLNPFISETNDRDAYRPNRKTKIVEDLGTLTQDENGISGEGQYFNFFRSLDQRVNKQGGSLRSFYASENVVKTADVSIRGVENQNGMISGDFVINLFAENADNSDTVKLKTLKRISIGETLKIMGNEGQVLEAEVVDINELDSTVRFNTPIPEFYSTQIKARAVKVL